VERHAHITRAKLDEALDWVNQMRDYGFKSH